MEHKPKYTKTTKAYKNDEFLDSREARTIRILCEYEETLARLRKHNIRGTVLFFGSARARSRQQYECLLKEANCAYQAATTLEEKLVLEKEVMRVQSLEWLCDYYPKVTELANRIASWSMKTDSAIAVGFENGRDFLIDQTNSWSFVDKNIPSCDVEITNHIHRRNHLAVATGGGPGFMEAANKGAAMVGATSIGMGVELPYESGINLYVTPELGFQFHYFFTRKFWMLYQCEALIVAPGGFGTMDELFELLTLKQTGKITRNIPVILLGISFWKSVISWNALVSLGVVGQQDIDDLFFTDSVDEAFNFAVNRIERNCGHLTDDPKTDAKRNKNPHSDTLPNQQQQQQQQVPGEPRLATAPSSESSCSI